MGEKKQPPYIKHDVYKTREEIRNNEEQSYREGQKQESLGDAIVTIAQMRKRTGYDADIERLKSSDWVNSELADIVSKRAKAKP